MRSMLPGALLAALATLAPFASAAALEVRFQSDRLYIYEEEPRRDLSTLVVQGLGVVQPDGPAVTLDEVRLEVVGEGRVLQSRRLAAEDLAPAAARMAALQERGMLPAYEFALQLGRYVPGARMAATPTLEPGTAVVLRGLPFLLVGTPDLLRVTATARTAGGDPVVATAEIPIEDHRSANLYRFPLAGPWLVAIGPGLGGHHRWVGGSEFALDIVRLGEGGLSHRGDGQALGDYFAYGEPVLAVADGEVVAVEAGVAEDTRRLRRPGETWEAFEERTVAEQGALVAARPIAVAGNYVTIRHEGGEHSHYAHLAGGSVTVKPGERVRRGQVIGRLGHTGNSTEPHLHFQMMDGPDPLAAGGLPVRFDDLEIYEIGTEPRHLQTGWMVIAAPGEAASVPDVAPER